MASEDAPDPLGSPTDTAAEAVEAPGRALRDGLVLAFAVGVVGIVFGVLARSSGLSVAKTCAMSLLVFTGASQLAAVAVISSGGSGPAALGSALLLAARNSLYGPVVAPWFADNSAATRAGVAQIIIDESTGMGAAQTTPADRRTGFLAAGLGTYVAWNLGTFVGAIAGDFIGDLQRWGLDAAFPAVYVAMLAPHLRTRPGRASALIAGAIAVATVPVLPIGVPILVSTAGAFAGAVLAHRERQPAAGVAIVSWWTIIAMAGGAYAFKVFGLFGLSRIELSGPLADLVRLLPAAMFAGLVLQQTLTGGAADVIATRLIGVIAGAVAVWAKAPLLVVIIVSAGVTALARVLT